MTFKNIYECLIKQNYKVISDLEAKNNPLKKISK